jgi:hypothetical protein
MGDHTPVESSLSATIDAEYQWCSPALYGRCHDDA